MTFGRVTRLVSIGILTFAVAATTAAQVPPLDPTLPAIDPALAGTDPGQRPVNPALAPTDPGQRPVNPALAPTDPGQRPVNPALAPTDPAQRPVNPALAPTDPAQRPVNPAHAPTDPAMPAASPRQVPARGVLGPAADPQGARPNRNAGEHRQITPADIGEMHREAERQRMRPFDSQNDVRQMQQGRDVPSPEQAREMQRRSAEARERAMDNFRNGAASDARTAQAVRDGIERSRQAFRNAIGGGAQAAALVAQAWSVLHPSDHTCLANAAPANMPIVPSMCAGSDQCADCYAEAYGRLNRTRGNFERLRCIWRWNQEYADRAKSFGDNVSSVHGISGLAWQQERRKIERALEQLGHTYDGKYRELLGYVRDDLASIGSCEARYFGNPDWSTRYGFMFYGFLEDRYRR